MCYFCYLIRTVTFQLVCLSINLCFICLFKLQDGVIYAWRGSSDSEAKSPFELVASLSGHTKAVGCLAVGGKMLYSGSMDHSIKVLSVNEEFIIIILNVRFAPCRAF